MEACWQCGGSGTFGSACIDDCCHGGDVPCFHGDESEIRCGVCKGKGFLPEIDGDQGYYDEMADGAAALRDGLATADEAEEARQPRSDAGEGVGA